MQGHTDSVFSVVFSSSGKLLASGKSENIFKFRLTRQDYKFMGCRNWQGSFEAFRPQNGV